MFSFRKQTILLSLSLSPFNSDSFCFVYFGALSGTYMFITVIASQWLNTFMIKCPSLSLVTVSVLQLVSCGITTVSLGYHLHGISFLSSYLCLLIKKVLSYKQHVIQVCFLFIFFFIRHRTFMHAHDGEKEWGKGTSSPGPSHSVIPSLQSSSLSDRGHLYVYLVCLSLTELGIQTMVALWDLASFEQNITAVPQNWAINHGV